jgi:translocation and assembly module TamB
MRHPLLAALVVLALGLCGLIAPSLGQQAGADEKGVLANVISRALSTPTTRVSIGAVEGALSSNATIRDVTIADQDGVWLTLDRARIVWRRTALLQRRLEIDTLEVDQLTMLRRPAPPEEAVPGEDEPLIPEIPIEVEVKGFTLNRLNLGEPVLGTQAQLTARGHARIGNPAEGISLSMAVDRSDAQGHAEITTTYQPQTERLSLNLALDEPEGGIAARLMALPGLPPVQLSVKGEGPLSNFAAGITFAAGPEIGATGRATLADAQGGRRITMALSARISPWLPPTLAPAFADATDLQGSALLLDTGGLRIETASLRSTAALLTVSGGVSAGRELDLKAALRNVPSERTITRVGDSTVQLLAVDAVVTGPAANPVMRANAQITGLRTPELRIDRASARFTLDPKPGDADNGFAVTLDGRAEGVIPRDPDLARALGPSVSLTLRTDVSRMGVASISSMRLQTPTLNADIKGQASQRALALTGMFEAPDLSALSGLSHLALAGSGTARIDLAGSPRFGRYEARLDGRLRNAQTGLPAIDRLTAGDIALAGGLRQTRRSLGFDDLRLNGGGITARIDGHYGTDGNDLTVTAAIADLSRAEAQLHGPAQFSARLTGAQAAPVIAAQLTASGGRLAFDGAVGETVDLKLAVEHLPLTVTALLAPEQAILGTLDAEARLTGPRSSPTGPFSVTVSKLSTQATRAARVGDMSLKASGHFADGLAYLDAAIKAGRAGALTAKGTIPLDADKPMDLRVAGSLDALAFNGLLAGTGRTMAGRAAVDLSLGGSFRKPSHAGSITLTGGRFDDPVAGISLAAITARLVARGDSLTIERASATTPNGGRLAMTGSIRLAVDEGLPGSVTVTARRAQLVHSPVLDATADINVTIDGPFLQSPRIRGRIGLVSADIRVPERLGRSQRPLPETTHVAPPPQARARLALAKAAEPKKHQAPPFDAILDLLFDAPRAIFVRGRGLDIELGGRLNLTGTLRAPIPIGEFTLRRGSFQLLAQRLEFIRGKLSLTGDLTPTLDLAAQTQAVGTTITVAVTGRADEPEFTVTSQPELPQDEALSRLLFGTVSAGLNPFQAVQLAQAVAQLSGSSTVDPFDSLRRSLGLDSLDLLSGSGAGVGIAKTIGSRARLGIQTGATPQQNGVTIDFDVTRRLRLRGEVDATGGSAVGAGAEWEW